MHKRRLASTGKNKARVALPLIRTLDLDLAVEG
jgi:hypothetical protein